MTPPPRTEPWAGPDRPGCRGWDHREQILLVVLILVGICLGWVLRFPAVLTGGDDLTYLLLGRALEGGAYRDIWLLGEPLHALYPPVMPVWVWFLTGVLGGGLGTIHLANLLLVALTAALWGDAVRRLGFAQLGVAVVGLVMLNPVLLGMAGTAVAETLLLALSSVSIWCMLRADQAGEAHRARWITLAVFFALTAFLTKAIGVVVVAAAMVALLSRARWRPAAAAMVASGLAVGIWFVYVRRAGHAAVGSSYLADLAVGHANEGTRSLLPRVLRNARYYFQEGLPELLGLAMVPGTWWDNLAWTVILIPAGLVGTVWLVRRWPATPVVLAGTLAILLFWPWGISRLGAPLIPLGVTSVVIGMMVGGRHLGGPRFGRAACAGTVLALALSLTVRLHEDWTTMRECPRPDPYSSASPCTTSEERALVAGARAVAAALPAAAVVATSKPQVVHWFGERRTTPIALLRGATPATLVAEMHRIGATHVLLSRMHPVEVRDLAPAFEGACSALTPVTHVPGPAALLAPRTAGEPDACEAIRTVRYWPSPDS